MVAWFAEASISHSVDLAFSVERWIESCLGLLHGTNDISITQTNHKEEEEARGIEVEGKVFTINL